MRTWRDRLEYIPAKMIEHELHYPKRACGKCKAGVTVASFPASDQNGAVLVGPRRQNQGPPRLPKKASPQQVRPNAFRLASPKLAS